MGNHVPTDFKWALEYVNIKTVYSLFTDWVTSGGVKNQEWWKTFDSSKVTNNNQIFIDNTIHQYEIRVFLLEHRTEKFIR